MNKSLLTNLIAAGLVAVGLALHAPYQQPVLNTGLFALAGAMTNWLAIHMLFEKVPWLYGSGVITARFSEFKTAIHDLIMRQFFSKENMDRFMKEMINDSDQHRLDFSDVIERTDLQPTYDGLVDTIMESSYGNMLSMFGGKSALESLKQPFISKMKVALNNMAHSDSFQHSVKDKLNSLAVFHDIHQHIDYIVQARLNELTPQLIKQIMQNMIRQHLGWLVVWGGIFGGLIGLSVSFIPV